MPKSKIPPSSMQIREDHYSMSAAGEREYLTIDWMVSYM